MRTPFVTLRNLVLCAISCAAISSVQAQTTIPASLKAPPGSWDPGRQGMVVIAHQQDAARAPGNQNSIANVERQLRGDFALPNIAAAGPHDVDFLNFSDDTNINRGFLVAPIIPEAALPGVSTTSAANYVCEVLGFLNLPSGETTFYVHCDDTFRFTIGNGDNPQDVLALQPDDATAVGRDWEVDPVPFTIAVPEAGMYPFRILYGQAGGSASLELFTYSDHEDVDGEELVVGKEVGEPYETHNIDAFAPASLTPASAYTSDLDPFLTESEASTLDPIRVLLTDGTTTTVDDGTITLAVDGVDVTSSIEKSKADGVTQVSYVPEDLLRSGQHTIAYSFRDSAGTLTEHAYDFLIAPFAALPASWAYPVGSGNPADQGFNGQIVVPRQDANLSGAVGIGNDQLAGRLIDSDTGAPFVNLAVTSDPGGWPGTPVGLGGFFDVDGAINYATDGAGGIPADYGFFDDATGFPNALIPGLPGAVAEPGVAPFQNTDDYAFQVTGYIELTAGLHLFGVHANDTFQFAGHKHNALDVFRTRLSEYGSNRGGTQVVVPVIVEADGLYPIRLMQQVAFTTGGNRGIEFWTAPPDDTNNRTLINSPDGFKVYRSLTVPTKSFVEYVAPRPAESGIQSDASIVIEMKDLGDVVPVLKVRGSIVEYDTAMVGDTTTLTYTPDDGFPASTIIRVELEYGEATASWSFTTETGLKCMFVNGAGPLGGSDAVLGSLLSSKYGFDIVPIKDSAATTNLVTEIEPALIIFSSTINSGAPEKDFELFPVPIINWESAYRDELNTQGGGNNNPNGTTTLTIVDATHPLAAGLSAGIHTFANEGVDSHSGVAHANATVIATLSPGLDGIYVVPQGTETNDGFIHPADRVFLGFIGNTGATKFTSVGFDLFEAAVEFLGFEEVEIVEDAFFTGISATGDQITISWDGNGTLQSTPSLETPTWTDVPGTGNPRLVTPSQDVELFNVVQ